MYVNPDIFFTSAFCLLISSPLPSPLSRPDTAGGKETGAAKVSKNLI